MVIISKILQKYYTIQVKKYALEVGDGLKVNRPSFIGVNTRLGNNVNFNGMRIGNGPCTIGNNFHSGQNCQIINQNHNYEGEKIPYDATYLYKEVAIEDNVWFGNDVIVIGNVHIGEGAIIQAGSVVVGDIPKCAIAGGNPAKVFKYRDIEHYDELKSKGLFH